jgi:hypothetical protein
MMILYACLGIKKGFHYDFLRIMPFFNAHVNIVGSTAFAMVGDPSRHALYVLITPGIDGGALEIDLPRNVLDSKASYDTDSRFVLAIDGRQISGEPTGICIGECANIQDSFKETQTTETDRVLTVLFGPEERVIEIVGNQGTIF